MSEKPPVGKKAPSFSLPVVGGEYEEGSKISLSKLKGSKVVLYFYPKDDTPGCTTQACGIRDVWGELSKKAKVFGVSIDPIKKHQKFIDKYELPFPLISDEEKTMVEAYGVWVEKKMYGKTYMGTERTTFVLDENGKVLAVFPKVKPAEHVDLLLEVLG
ncbi:MAG: thioredoxin-dependent thiol peroxidase [Verrucomicrobiales bacterium]|nr:thioredoxin-dependent thiol peroxidase [Verrucomicrobiales bacterium]